MRVMRRRVCQKADTTKPSLLEMPEHVQNNKQKMAIYFMNNESSSSESDSDSKQEMVLLALFL